MTMRMWLRVSAGFAVVFVLWTGTALAQGKPACDAQGKAMAPGTVEGQVVKVDTGLGKVTVREAAGTVHEFQASAETLQDLKVGDRIGAKLREAPKCP
jgi:hypothetical protein